MAFHTALHTDWMTPKAAEMTAWITVMAGWMTVMMLFHTLRTLAMICVRTLMMSVKAWLTIGWMKSHKPCSPLMIQSKTLTTPSKAEEMTSTAAWTAPDWLMKSMIWPTHCPSVPATLPMKPPSRRKASPISVMSCWKGFEPATAWMIVETNRPIAPPTDWTIVETPWKELRAPSASALKAPSAVLPAVVREFARGLARLPVGRLVKRLVKACWRLGPRLVMIWGRAVNRPLPIWRMRGATFLTTVVKLVTSWPLRADMSTSLRPRPVSQFCQADFMLATEPSMVVEASLAVVPVMPRFCWTRWMAWTTSLKLLMSNFLPMAWGSSSASLSRRSSSLLVPP